MNQRMLLVLLALLSPLYASAEYWMSSTKELLQTAKSIEIIKVSAVKDYNIEGSVSESIRGKSVGTKMTVSKLWSGGPEPVKDNELLVICDDGMCPRAVGVDRGGYFVLWAQEPGDGAQVLPGLIERASLPLLASGKTAPDLCVRATVTFIDEPGTTASFEGKFSALDGTGSLTSKLLSKSSKGSFRMLDSYSESSSLHLNDAQVTFIGGAISRAKDGCYETTVIPARPLSRTMKSLKSSLAGTRSTTTILGSGKIHIDSGKTLKAGDYTLSIELDSNGQLRFISPLFVGDTVQISDAKGRIGFSIGKSSPYPALMIDLGTGSGHFPEAGTEGKIAELLTKGSLKWSVFVYDMSASGTPSDTPVGKATVSHVAD